MKKGILSVFILMSLLGFASAQGLSDVLNSIDESTIIIYATFIISFSLLFFSLKKVFKNDLVIAGIVSAILSLLIVYGVNRSGINIPEFFYNIGISSDILMTILPIIILLGAIFIIIKLKVNSLFVFGALLIVASLFVYEQSALIFIGISLIAVGIFLKMAAGKKKKDK